MVIAIVMRAEKLVGLFDQILVVVPDFLRRGERGGAVGGDIHLDQRVVGQLDDLEEFAGDYWRIDQRGQGSRLKRDLRLAVLAGAVDAMGRGVPYFQFGGKFQSWRRR